MTSADSSRQSGPSHVEEHLAAAKRQALLVNVLRLALKWPRSDFEIIEASLAELQAAENSPRPNRTLYVATTAAIKNLRQSVVESESVAKLSPLNHLKRGETGDAWFEEDAVRSLPGYEAYLFGRSERLSVPKSTLAYLPTLTDWRVAVDPALPAPKPKSKHAMELTDAIEACGQWDGHTDSFASEASTPYAELRSALVNIRNDLDHMASALASIEKSAVEDEAKCWQNVSVVADAFAARENRHRSSFIEYLAPETLRKRRNALGFCLAAALAASGLLSPKIGGFEFVGESTLFCWVLLAVAGWSFAEFLYWGLQDRAVARRVGRTPPLLNRILQFWAPMTFCALLLLLSVSFLAGSLPLPQDAPTEPNEHSQIERDSTPTNMTHQWEV